jgi:hypothetical protein
MIRSVLLLLFPVLLHAQTAPSLNPDECGGGTITRSERYRGRALAGYMNGGAELYHEYGFVALSVQDIALKDAGTVTVEVFRMSSAMAAFGILSIFRQGCTGPDTVDICAGPFQVQGIARDCYIRVQSGTNTPEAVAARLRLCRQLMRRVGCAEVVLSPAFHDPRTAILMNGPLGVQNGMPDLAEILDGVEGYAVQAELLRLPGEAIDLVAEVSFRSDERSGGFVASLGVPAKGGDVVEVPGHKGWWVLARSGKPVQILRGAVDKDHAMAFFRSRMQGRN